MAVRAKFQLQDVTNHSWSQTAKTVVFRAQYDPSIPEDQRFAKATPSGEFRMTVDNPAALDQLEIGKSYYFDISEVPAVVVG